MTLQTLWESLEASAVGDFIASSPWAFPTIESIHVIALVTVVGTVAIMDLRLLGLASGAWPVTQMSKDTLRWTWMGFLLAAITGSLLAQTIDGLDQLLQMPFGCGEQNMILFAPDTFILKYLKGTNQLKPEIQAKAEMLLITGYQRELTYRHNDGSFSAFGEQDESGSLWLTAFVLKTFSQAKDIRTKVMAGAANGTLRFNIDQRQGMVAGGLAGNAKI